MGFAILTSKTIDYRESSGILSAAVTPYTANTFNPTSQNVFLLLLLFYWVSYICHVTNQSTAFGKCSVHEQLMPIPFPLQLVLRLFVLYVFYVWSAISFACNREGVEPVFEGTEALLKLGKWVSVWYVYCITYKLTTVCCNHNPFVREQHSVSNRTTTNLKACYVQRHSHHVKDLQT